MLWIGSDLERSSSPTSPAASSNIFN